MSERKATANKTAHIVEITQYAQQKAHQGRICSVVVLKLIGQEGT